MRLQATVVAVGCSLALTWAKSHTNEQPVADKNDLQQIESVIPDRTGFDKPFRLTENPTLLPPKSSGITLEDVLKHPRETVNSWDDPWKSLGMLVLNLGDVILKLISFAISLIVPLVLGAIALGIIAALAGPTRKLIVGVAEHPAAARTVLSAGLGTGFGLLLFMAIVDLCEQGFHEMLRDLTAIAIVSIGVLIFIEPIEEWFANRLGTHGAGGHSHAASKQRWHLRAAAIGILAAVSISHGLLHKEIEHDIRHALSMLLFASPITAATTYAWIRGARLEKSRAAVAGAITAAAMGAICWLVVLWIGNPDGFNFNDVEKVSVLINALQWGVAGFFGGMAIDQRWASTPARGAGIAVTLALVCTGILGGGERIFVLQDLARALGWAGGLIAIEPFACAAFGCPWGEKSAEPHLAKA